MKRPSGLEILEERDGIPGLIPPDAVLTVHVWLREVKATDNAVERTR